ncbi:hypothetical protein F4054_01870 [Candidatus Poribacteria bacterium]|nr:hypothetical protein [Candidatus Poribacteria bacterium]MYK20989.1 hypothetical protein [Candidatus Poribacteria bacterium]
MPRTFYEYHRKNAASLPLHYPYWIRNFAGEHAKPPHPEETDAVVLVLDEMWHYVKEKKTNSGSIPSPNYPGLI